MAELTESWHLWHDSIPLIVFAGALLAVAALQQAAAPGVMCLRRINPYVGAALGDWQRRAGEAPLVPRSFTGAPELCMEQAVAGEPFRGWAAAKEHLVIMCKWQRRTARDSPLVRKTAAAAKLQGKKQSHARDS